MHHTNWFMQCSGVSTAEYIHVFWFHSCHTEQHLAVSSWLSALSVSYLFHHMPHGVLQLLYSSSAFHYLSWFLWGNYIFRDNSSQAHTVSSGKCVPILKAILSAKPPLIYTVASFIFIWPCLTSSFSILPSTPWKGFSLNHMGNAFSLFQISSVFISLPKACP